ncbi:SusC/RagA family TonB-linked outer membrane protein [Pseudochryseolinea flava]|uniref:SusC/RagA family TonB-linked outer membrane protein n=1 Tax=Pseudochryseolinea flava TaxID=2059302 RepID=A0A364Y2V1_9BACT|nr:TonB-dependent receptor [Pseudochryseolinea flava]RAW01215.1 SusC/RagA family TonB-linked outer membrane protein [Pseudochryseolinea flava]
MMKLYQTCSKVLFLILMLISSEAWAQAKITGTVKSADDGTGLPGVSVVEKGTNNGTVTDSEGRFSIQVPENSTLVFSFVGYSTQEASVTGRSVVDIDLQSDITALSEVVVVGYGQQEMKDVTGVVTAITTESFNRGAIVAPEQLISGKIAGVQVTQNSGEPGGGLTVRVRGGTSINAGNDPLYVIDGVPVDNVGYPGGRNPLNFLNPNEIESFTVLKDASAAAIYGSRAANGVIIITTKKGKAGSAATVTYDGFYSISKVTKELDVLDAAQFTEVVAQYFPNRLGELSENTSTNWQDELLQDGITQSHNISVSGGGEKTGIRASVGYVDQTGTITKSGTTRTTFAVNANQKLFDDKLSIDANLKVAETKDRYNGAGIGAAYAFAPTQPIYDEDSEYGGYFEWSSPQGAQNPIAIQDLTKHIGKVYRGLGNLQFDYRFDNLLPGLRANLNLGADIINAQRRFFQPTYLKAQATASAPGQVDIETTNRMNKLIEYYFNYVKEFSFGKIDATAGYSWQDFTVNRSGLTARGLTTNDYGYENPSVGDPERTVVFADPQENRLISFFGRVNYSWKDKYLVTVNYRRDGSSRFGESNRWGSFPSAAFAWRISDEDFFTGLKNTFADFKFRASYGINGNQEIGNYLYIPTYTATNGFAEYPFGDEFVSPIKPTAVDRDIKWEETASLNIGLDFGLLQGRLTGSVEFYNKKTTDLLFVVNTPAGTAPGDRVLTNIGSVRNRGVELSLEAVAIDKGDLRWNVGFNISTNKNEIISLDGTDDPAFQGYETGGIAGGVGSNIQILKVGNPVNAYRVFEHLKTEDGKLALDGVDYNHDGVADLKDMYADLNGDGNVNDQDRVPTESPNPKVLLGLTSNLTYKNFDLGFTLRGSIGNYVYNNVASANGAINILGANQVLTNIPSSALETGFSNFQLSSDHYLEDGSFLRMDNLTLGYRIEKLKQAKIRVYGTIQNLFILTNYSGMDPEIPSGIDNNVYPRSRTFLVGVNVGF